MAGTRATRRIRIARTSTSLSATRDDRTLAYGIEVLNCQ
jgi:hypothetical protein